MDRKSKEFSDFSKLWFKILVQPRGVFFCCFVLFCFFCPCNVVFRISVPLTRNWARGQGAKAVNTRRPPRNSLNNFVLDIDSTSGKQMKESIIWVIYCNAKNIRKLFFCLNSSKSCPTWAGCGWEIHTCLTCQNSVFSASPQCLE